MENRGGVRHPGWRGHTKFCRRGNFTTKTDGKQEVTIPNLSEKFRLIPVCRVSNATLLVIFLRFPIPSDNRHASYFHHCEVHNSITVQAVDSRHKHAIFCNTSIITRHFQIKQPIFVSPQVSTPLFFLFRHIPTMILSTPCQHSCISILPAFANVGMRGMWCTAFNKPCFFAP